MLGADLWRCVRGSVVAGVVVRERVVVQAAPILRWTVGKTWAEVRESLRGSGWHGNPLKSPARSGVLLVCGGRDYADRDRVFAVLDAVAARATIERLRHGACGLDEEDPIDVRRMRGADRWAHEWALARGVTPDAVPARWKALGRRAGPERNGRMLVDGALGLVAFPGGAGTTDLSRRAEVAGLEVWRV